MGTLAAATEAAIKAAHEAKALTDADAGAVEALRLLARKIDAWDVIVQWALEDVTDEDGSGRPLVPANDNVSIPTYLKYAEQLGLTPNGRVKLPKGEEGTKPGGKLAGQRAAVPRPKQ
jgi:hypothetical protein